MEVIRVIRETEFEMISIILILPTGHKMLVIGAYHPPRFSYDETDFLNRIVEVVDDFLDINPNGLVLFSGDINHLNVSQLSTMSGMLHLVDFPTRGQAILDNCLTNRPELFNKAYPLHIQMKTDHLGVIIPAGIKLKPLRTNYESALGTTEHRIKSNFKRSLPRKVGLKLRQWKQLKKQLKYWRTLSTI
jgi:hypothetical protein